MFILDSSALPRVESSQDKKLKACFSELAEKVQMRKRGRERITLNLAANQVMEFKQNSCSKKMIGANKLKQNQISLSHKQKRKSGLMNHLVEKKK